MCRGNASEVRPPRGLAAALAARVREAAVEFVVLDRAERLEGVGEFREGQGLPSEAHDDVAVALAVALLAVEQVDGLTPEGHILAGHGRRIAARADKIMHMHIHMK